MYEHAHWDYIVCPRYTFCVCDLGNPFPSRGLGFYKDLLFNAWYLDDGVVAGPSSMLYAYFKI